MGENPNHSRGKFHNRYSRRTFLGQCGAAAAGGALLGSPSLAGSSGADSGRPNIIFILADDMGFADISPYGAAIDTPNLQRLADDGMSFTQMHNTSKCFPSRACLLTGLYAQQTHMHDSPEKFENSVFFGEVLRRAGYRTLFIGKHHGTDNPYNWGFHHYRGLRDGAANYFNPGKKRPLDPGEPAQKEWGYPRTFVFDDEVVAPFTPESRSYYSTDTWTDWALELLRRYEDEDRPFCLYLSYQAPHDPLQVWREDYKKYEGRYDQGFGAVRRERYRRQIESGLLDEDTFPLSEHTHREWNKLSEKEKEDEARRMEVYAGMIDRLDRNIGRVMNHLRERGEMDNTIIMFASDNGASAEVVKIGNGPIGSMTRWASLKEDWANVGNTPFRYYKNYSYEGGTCTPLIVHWPGVVEPGSTTHYVSHFIDIMPTLVDIASADYPDRYRGDSVLPMQGTSLLPVLKGEERRRRGPLFWKWRNGRAIYREGWKLIDQGDRGWELYNLREDRTETNDLSDERPKLVKQLAREWKKWYKGTAKYRT